eukprot:SAG31_NODE_23185_length_509_cov_1.197561_2_plen_55_part_01
MHDSSGVPTCKSRDADHSKGVLVSVDCQVDGTKYAWGPRSSSMVAIVKFQPWSTV